MYYTMLAKQASNYGCMEFDKIGIIHFSENSWEKRDHPLFGESKGGCSDTYGKLYDFIFSFLASSLNGGETNRMFL
ncbi:hypothetical protein RHGRI_032729 [Rhododendron griersonianum]|uniref:Uncharacterized protein n=1 Tax=Rhododendron griersonianum TaxID=479676 RepID=A0AAV6IIN9_9ERIC|nr:hypothetical protein RHGRI_032729 [Rhododendron griersonianum]